jgi:exodeoxyribonuclease-3
MKSLISWNVNGIRAISKKGFRDWFLGEAPDILCLQETKAHPEQVPEEARTYDGYTAYWAQAKRRGYSGVAVFTRIEPRSVSYLGDPEFDDEGRVLSLEFDEFTLVNAYFPNSQEKGARLGYKLAFCAAILEHCNDVVQAGKNLVLCGDYNIAHKPIDLANPKQNEKNPGYLPEERAWMDEFVDAGYVDTFRAFNKEPGNYTWWTYRFNAREKNIGWRIDYHCVNQTFMPHVKQTRILSSVMGSDHCPIRLEVE